VEPVEEGQEFLVVVDYAHTPDSILGVLQATRPLATGRLIVVFGCGGDRDRAKRPLMGRAATSNADLTIITSDNPRSEDPLQIVAAIEPGAIEGGGEYRIEPDRRAAIALALAEASPGDAVVIAGKGHEGYQEFADRTVVFDDRAVAREELRALRGPA
jgi:UDP-N-acetylmuramoyl-L-alanyl-D-glutamate--2,6-diaminopimelate ligase